MATVLDLKTAISTYLKTTVGALTIGGVDLTLLALNNARRSVELAHDFFYSQTNVYLFVSATGGLITQAFAALNASGTLTVSGTLTPDLTGAYPPTGTYLGNALYSLSIGGVVYNVFNTGGGWFISGENFQTMNHFVQSPVTASPDGTYTGTGTYSGTATVTGGNVIVGIKRIQNAFLPIASGDSIPIEFLTNDEWNSRIKRQIGRQIYNNSFTLPQIGVYSENPVCFQQGQMICLVPASQYTFPVTVGLSVVQWMPDYVNDADSDFFTQYGPEFLQWQGIIECNKLVKFFAQRREGNLDETNLQAEASQAMQALLAWDFMIVNGTSTPYVPPAPEPAAA